MSGIRGRLYNAYRVVMTTKFTQMDVIRWRGGVGLVGMLALGYWFEEWYYYSPQTKPIAEDTIRQYIQWRKDLFKKKTGESKESPATE